MDDRQSAEIEQEFGVKVVGRGSPKATYYKPDGEAMPNLPADTWAMMRYLKRGFTLSPPNNPLPRKRGRKSTKGEKV